MTFDDLNNIMEEKFGAMRLADIAREFDVTPQVVSNWKSRNQVPYKYVKILRSKIAELENPVYIADYDHKSFEMNSNNDNNNDDIDIFEIIKFIVDALKNNKALFVLFPMVLTVYQVINLLFYVDPEFISTARILPGTISDKSRISGFAAQFGINVGQNSSAFTAAELYPDVIRSRLLLKGLLNRRFDTKRYGKNKKLVQILLGESNELDSMKIDIFLHKGIRQLKKMIKVSTSRKTSLIDVSVNAFEPNLASGIAVAIIEKLDSLQNDFKIGRIKEKRIFIESRIAELDIDLNQSEEALKKFREENRNINSSPALLLEESRIQRELTVLTQLYITLKNEFEQMQIEEVEQSRMFAVLDAPETPFKKTGPNRKAIVISFFIFGLILSLSTVVIKHWLGLNFNKKIRPFFD